MCHMPKRVPPDVSLWHQPLYERGRASVKSPADRFWSLVQRSDSCWLWVGRFVKNGYQYGYFDIGEKSMYAHRFSWALHHGLMPPDGMHICHTCDVPQCVRPDHLFLGTARENKWDSIRKGRAMCFGRRQEVAMK